MEFSNFEKLWEKLEEVWKSESLSYYHYTGVFFFNMTVFAQISFGFDNGHI